MEPEINLELQHKRYLIDYQVTPKLFEKLHREFKINITRSQFTHTLILNIQFPSKIKASKLSIIDKIAKPNLVRISDYNQIQIHFNHRHWDYIPMHHVFNENHPLATYKDKNYAISLAIKIINSQK